jgi:ABC-type phosphate/phosphonate transport system substrate-binding protein
MPMRLPISYGRSMSNDGSGGSARIASLAMYPDPPEVAAATRALWACLRDHLRAGGIRDVPERLDDRVAYDAAWCDPRLLLAQTCGYPFVTQLRDRVRLVATPVYEHPGCVGAMNGSFLVVRAGSAASVADLRGKVAAINDPLSNSGMNLFRHLVAPLAGGRRFFERVSVSGSHLASLAMVVAGEADVAAIDCVTYGNVARFAPHTLAGSRVLAETTKTPGLPLITRATTSDGELETMRRALNAVANDPATAQSRAALGLGGFVVVPDSAYDIVLEIEREAVSRGYPWLA